MSEFKLEYEDLPSIQKLKKTRKGGKGHHKMSNKATTKEATVTKKRYAKTRGEHIKDIVIAVLIASIVAFALGIAFESGRNSEMQQAVASVTAEAVETPVKK